MPHSQLSRVLTVITPVGAGRDEWLDDAANSVQAARAELPSGWNVEWIVVYDGHTPKRVPEGVDRVVRWSFPAGVSAARNAALGYATGAWVFPLDADDRVHPSGLAAALNFVTTLPDDVGWVALSRVFLDGSPTVYTFEHTRAFTAGELAEEWVSPFQFHPNSVLFRRDILLRAGGWPAVPVNEDLGCVLLCSEIAAGQQFPATVTRYRVSEGQMTASLTWNDDRRVAFRVIEKMVNARRAAASRSPIVAPLQPKQTRVR